MKNALFCTAEHYLSNDMLILVAFNSVYMIFQYNSIILEIKAIESLTSSHTKQTLNYLAASKLKLGLLVNFGEDSLKYKRIIL